MAHITLVETQGAAQHVAMMLPALETSEDEGKSGHLYLELEGLGRADNQTPTPSLLSLLLGSVFR